MCHGLGDERDKLAQAPIVFTEAEGSEKLGHSLKLLNALKKGFEKNSAAESENQPITNQAILMEVVQVEKDKAKAITPSTTENYDERLSDKNWSDNRVTASNLIQNPSFESGATQWTQYSKLGLPNIIKSTLANTGSYLTALGGVNSEFGFIEQSVFIPTNTSSANLEFWYRILTYDSNRYPYDILVVSLYSINNVLLSTLMTRTNVNATAGWVKSSVFDLTAYKGQAVKLHMGTLTDSTYPTFFLIDDVNLTVVDSSPVNQTITFGPTPSVTVGSTGTVSATASSGLPVTFSSSTPGICTVSGSTVGGIAAGICSLAANQAGNSSFSPAAQVTQSFSINEGAAAPGSPTIISITAGSGSATLNFTAPSHTGGSAISAYTASCTASGQSTRTATGATSPLTVKNLSGGVLYQCTLTATNSGGLTGSASAAQPVTPTSGKSGLTPILMLLLN
jgi:hypothetical protein